MNWTPDCKKMIWTENKLAQNQSYFGGNQKTLDQILCFASIFGKQFCKQFWNFVHVN